MSHPFSKRQFPRRHYRKKMMLVSKEVYDRTPPEVRRSLNMKIYQREKAISKISEIEQVPNPNIANRHNYPNYIE